MLLMQNPAKRTHGRYSAEFKTEAPGLARQVGITRQILKLGRRCWRANRARGVPVRLTLDGIRSREIIQTADGLGICPVRVCLSANRATCYK